MEPVFMQTLSKRAVLHGRAVRRSRYGQPGGLPGGGPEGHCILTRSRRHDASAFAASPEGSELMRFTSRDSSQAGERAQ